MHTFGACGLVAEVKELPSPRDTVFSSFASADDFVGRSRRTSLPKSSMPSSSPILPHTGQRAGDRSIGQRPGPAGFALVIALVLMGFIMLLVLTLSSLVQTNLATSSLEQQATQAQRNALLGVQLAIGQLQQYAGADKVATARANIDETAANNLQWTGAWDEDGKLITYFVSGNENGTNALLYDTSKALNTDRTTASAAELGILLSKRIDTSDATDADAVAKLIRLGNNGSEGGYAYWVSDESVKAKINLLPVAEPASAPANFGLMVPQMFGFSELQTWFDQASLFKSNGTLDEANLLKLGAAIDMGTLSAYKGSSAKDLSRDVTFYSYGVLSNPRTGGLKKDLTAAFDGSLDPTLASTNTEEKQIISGKAGTPLWDQLYSWVQATPSSSEWKVRAATNKQSGIYPVLLGFQLYMVPAYQDVAGVYKLYSYIVPTVALWNPYNYKLEAEDYNILAGRIQRSTDVDYLMDIGGEQLLQSYLILLATDAAGSTYKQATADFDAKSKLKNLNALRNITNRYVSGSYVHNETLEFTIASVSLEPGEVKIYSADKNQSFLVGGDDKRLLVEGDNAFGFSIDLERNLNLDPTTSEPIAKFKPAHAYINNSPTRVGALQLSIAGGDVLSDAVYLNQTESTLGKPNPSGGYDIQLVPGDHDPLELNDGSNTRAFGWLALRNIGIGANTRYALRDHKEKSQLIADHKWLAHYNPRASTSGLHPLSYRVQNVDVDFNPYATTNPSFVSLADHRGNVHDSVSHLKDQLADGMILFEASPGIENIFSIGQLTHAPLFYWDDGSFVSTDTKRVRPRVEKGAFDNLIPANPIGNSLANPAIPLSQTEQKMNYGGPNSEKTFLFPDGTLYDYSYLLNEALWDDYFFSAVISSGGAPSSQTYSASRNPRISLVPGKEQVKRGLTTSAEDLLIDGPFNVNSTSANAWKALLTSFYGRTPGSANRIIAPTGDGKVLGSFMRVANTASSLGSTDPAIGSKEAYTGYRTLSEEQIDKLADAIVAEIRRRGIAPSLSAFVNRSLDGDKASQLQGVLSAAITNAQLGDGNAINKKLSDDGYESSGWSNINSDGAKFQSNDAATGYVTEGLPGWLTSADILSRLGSVLTSRGDTFLIRSYGEYGSDNSLSTAWCEAVVQRLPEQVDVNETDLSKVKRRFVVVAFRWLAESEI